MNLKTAYLTPSVSSFVLTDYLHLALMVRSEKAISTAKNEANETARRWAAPVDRDNRAAGGYFFQTYKALCRRHGVFSNAQGPHDWNAELIAPLTRTISYGWGKTFSRRVPAILRGFASDAASLIESFHDDIEEGGRRNDGAPVSLQMLSQQLRNYQELFKDLCSDNSKAIQTEAKEINRMFLPVIAEAVGPAYTVCTDESGMTQILNLTMSILKSIFRTRKLHANESTHDHPHRLYSLDHVPRKCEQGQAMS
jgi:hypothetical protein